MKVPAKSAAPRSRRKETPVAAEVLFQNNPLPMWVYDAETLQFLEVNKAAARTCGYSINEFLGMRLPDVSADGRLPQEEPKERSGKNAGKDRQGHILVRRKDGHILAFETHTRSVEHHGRQAELMALIQAGPPPEAGTNLAARPVNYTGAFISEGELRALFEAIPDLILVLDKDGRFVKIGPGYETMLSLPPEELLGKKMHEVLSQPKADEFVGHIQQALGSGRPVQFEYAMLIGPQVRWFSGAAAPLTRESVVWVARDITPQKKVEEQVQRRLLELEALYESGLALGQTLDPREIGTRVIHVLSRRLKWHYAALHVRRGDSDDVELLASSEAAGAAETGLEGRLAARDAVTKIGQGMAGWVMQHGRMINCDDLTTDPRYHETVPGMLSGLYVPIWAGGRVLGCICVESRQRQAFTEADERLLTTLASQTAAALENARLFAESQQRVSESLSLFEFTRDLAAQSDLPTLLKVLADRVASLLRVPGGAVYLLDEKAHELEIVMSNDNSLPPGTRLAVGQGMAGKVAETREPLVVDDYQLWPGRPEQYLDRDWAAVLEVPMLYRGELIGVLAAYQLHLHEPSTTGESRRFREEDVRLLSLFAASAAGAIYSARLFDAERLRREEAEALRTAALGAAERMSALHAATRDIAHITQDPEELYASIHHAVSRIMPVDAFAIALVDEKRDRIRGVYLYDRNGLNPPMDIPYDESFTGRVIRAGETLLFNDIEEMNVQRMHFGSPEHVRAVLAVPLRVGEHIVGTISAQSYSRDVYHAEEQVLLEMLAAQAAIAIQNARLYQEALRSAERQAVIRRASQSLTRINPEPEELYASIHAAAAQLMPADVFTIALVREDEDEFEAVYAVDGGKRGPVINFPKGTGFSGWVIDHKQTLFLSDAWAAGISRLLPFAGAAQTRSVLMVPLQLGEVIIGAMSVQTYEANQYSEEDQAILEMLASQVAIAIQNGRLFQETSRRAVEFQALYESANMLPLQQEMSSLLDLVLERATRLLQAAGGSVYLFDPEQQLLMPVRRLGVDADAGAPLKLGEGAGGRVALTREPLIIDEYTEWEGRSAKYEGLPFRALLGVPMLYGDELIGVLAVHEYGETPARKFTEEEARLLSLFATQAAGAIYNVRLLEDTRRRLHEFESLARVGDALTGTLELEPLLENILRSARQAIPAAEKGTILLSEVGEQGHLHMRAQVGYGDRDLMDVPFDDTKGYAGRAFHEKRPILVRNSMQEYEVPFGQQFEEVNAIQSAIVAPLIVKDVAIGAISLDNGSRPSAFDEADLRLLLLFASSAAVVIENARLFDETRRRAEEFEVLYDATRDISSNPQDVSSLLSALVDKAARLLGSYGSAIYLFDPARADLEVAVVSKGGEGIGAHIKLGEGAAGRVAETRAPILIDDYQTWEGRRPSLDGTPYRAVLQVPMLYGGDLIGVVDVFEYGDSQRKFNDADAKLLALFASQAAAAVHSARLFDVTRRKAAQFASLYETARDLSGQRNLNQLLETIVERASKLLDAPVSVIYLYDKAQNNLYVAVNKGLEESLGIRMSMGQGLAGRVAESRQPMIVDDYQTWEGRAQQYEGLPLRSVLDVPMLYSGDLIGVLTVEELGDSQRKFTAEDAELLSLFASYAASAVHTARLFEQITRRAGEFEALYQTASDLSAQTDVQTLLDTVIERARKLMNVAGSGAYLYDAQAGDLELVAANDPDVPRGSRLPLGSGLSGKVALTKQPLVVNDYQSWEGRSRRYDGIPFTSELAIPMLYSGQLVGVLSVFNRADRAQSDTPATFAPQDVHVLELFANSVAGAVYVARLLEQTRRRVDQLSALHAVDTAIGSTTDLRVSLQAVLDSAVRQLRVDAANVLLLIPSTLTLQYAAGNGFFTSEINRTAISIGSGLAGRVALDRQMIHIPDLAAQDIDLQRGGLVAAERFRAYVGVPLIAKGEVKGVLELFQRGPLEFDEEHRSLLEVLAGQAALAIDNAQLFEGLEKANLELTMAYDATIEGWSQALELRDQETQGHSSRVLDLTLRLASAMGVPDRQLRDIRRGVLLHDIGKMGIPDAILHKPGPLTPDERQIMRQHPQYAYDMLSPIVYLRNSLDIPYAHHERWDGTGYPRGLKAETIPLAARIFCVVDVYDALTSNRPYRGAWSERSTLDYIAGQSGKHFDPRIVEAFFRLMRG